MSNSIGFLIRDGKEEDIVCCLNLDSQYTTDFVWQVSVTEKPAKWQVTFTSQQLPRILEVKYPIIESRLRLSLRTYYLFRTREAREGNEVLGFLTMRADDTHNIAIIEDVDVNQPYRCHHIDTRLVPIARSWAKEYLLSQLMTEISTQNFPTLLFYQNTGFQLCGFNDHYFANDEIAIFLAQSLQ